MPHSPASLNSAPKVSIKEKSQLGLGWHIIKDDQIHIHIGDPYRFRTFMAFAKQRQTAVSILTSSFQVEDHGPARLKLDVVQVD